MRLYRWAKMVILFFPSQLKTKKMKRTGRTGIRRLTGDKGALVLPRQDLKYIFMEERKWEPDSKTGNPEKAYRDELENKGSMVSDTPSESDARDKAKVEKALSGESQKMDSVHPDELLDDDDEAIRRETLENK